MNDVARGHTPRGPDPQMFGRYRLLGRLAIGGMAEVWAAQLLATGGFVKPMVIKRVLPELASNPSFLRMLMGEARVAAKLSHGNVCSVFELGAVNGEYYLAMEYLRGAALTQVIRAGGPLRPTVAATILAQVCDGLHYAHEQRDSQGRLLGLVHRDVSPHNLFVTVDGVVKVLDFGIAKVDDGSMGDRTEAGKVKGKLPYMSPEQLAAEALDRRADVWSLGAVLFELVTGKRLFNGPGMGATVDAIRNARVPTLESMGVHAPALDEVLARALCKSPQWRFGSAAEMRRALVEAIQPAGLAGNEELTELVWTRCGAQVRQHDRLFDVEDPDPHVSERLPLRAEPSSLLALPDAATQATRELVVFVDESSASFDRVAGGVDTRAGTEDDDDDSQVDGRNPTIVDDDMAGMVTPDPDRAPTVITKAEPVSKLSNANPATAIAHSETDVVPAPPRDLPRKKKPPLVSLALAIAVPMAVAVIWFVRRPDAPAPQPPAVAKAAPAPRVESIAQPAPAADPTPDPTPPPKPAPVPSPSVSPDPDPVSSPAPRRDKPARARKAPQPEPAVAKKEAPGKLSIDARPWATIYLDGKKIGPTPIVNRDVPAGDHTIRAVAEDGTEKTLRVHVEPGGTVRRKVTW